ncbi:helix-turn-helix domain-containing protein [Bacteroides sp.]
MKNILKILSFVIIALLFSVTASAGEVNTSSGDKNPLLEMVGKPYAEYHETYMHTMSSLLHGDSLSRVRLITLFNEAAATDKSGEWKLISGIVANTVRFYNSRRGGYVCSPDYTSTDFSTDMRMLAARAGKQGFPLLQIFILYQAAEGYRVFVEDYEQAFDCYLEAAAMLDSVTTKEFPPRPHIYNEIANLYYNFGEYNDAIKYFQKVTLDPDASDNYYGSLNSAINGIALSYRNGYADYERSDSCFTYLLERVRTNEQDRTVWEGITEANIGYNFYLRGEPDIALSWLVPGIGKITRPNDFKFVSNRMVDVANIFLEKGKRETAKKYIDMALEYYAHTRIPKKESRLYEVLTRYYTMTGNSKTAAAYLDSTLAAKNKETESFSGLVLQRIEQRLRVADQKLLKQQIDAEHAQSQMYLYTTILTGVALVIILVLLGLTLFYYRRKRNAYRELVRHSQQWAGIEIPITAEQTEPEELQPIVVEETVCNDKRTTMVTETELSADNHDEMIMAEVEKAMIERKVYKRIDLTLDVLAKEIGYNRYYLSNALNRCTGKNFNSYVNEFRVKEAIRIMSEPREDNLTTDAIAFEAGFNDRQALYRVFKKTTGLSPRDFRMNRTE